MEKTPYSPRVPPCKHLPPPIPTPDLEIAGLLPQHAHPCSGASVQNQGFWDLCLALPALCVTAASRLRLRSSGIHPRRLLLTAGLQEELMSTLARN